MAEPAANGGGASSSWRDLAKRHEGRVALVLLFLITIPMLTKIFTSDFGTHIAMGRQIVQTLSIPDKEFLNYPSLGRENPNGEWGFQALLYLVFAAGGVYGVSFLCWAVVFGIFWLLYEASLLRGARPILSVLAIFAFSGFLRIRIQPRPEIFTYLFIAMTIFLFSEYYYGRRKRLLYVFPLMIFVWANMHPTYLMGFLLCGAFLADGLVRAMWRRELRWGTVKTWLFPPLIVGMLGLILCGANPHGYEALLLPLHLISRGTGAGGGDSNVLMSISELTPVKGTGFFIYYQAAAVFATLSLLIGVVGRRLYFLDLFLFAIAFKGAWDSARAVSMMGLFLSPGVSLHLTGISARISEWFPPRETSHESKTAKGQTGARPGKKSKGKGKEKEESKGSSRKSPRFRASWASTVIMSVLVIVPAIFGGSTIAFSFSQLQYGVGLTEHKFSLSAGEFLRKYPIPGKMFNFFDVGGFLDWQLYPGALTFIDGRTYNQKTFMEHQLVTSGMAGWENVLHNYNVTYIVTKAMDSSGMVLPLIQALANHTEWELVFADGLFVIFVHDTPETRDYIAAHRLPKARIPQHIIWEAYHYMYLGVPPVTAYQTMSNMYMLMGNRQAAIEAIRKALEYADEPILRARLMQLEGGGLPPRGGGR